MAKVSNKREGFTLVELLIVIIIIGILAAIAVPQFTNSSLDAKESTLVSNLATLRNAIELYYHQHGGKYPGAMDHTDGIGAPATGDEDDAFVAQLTQYSDKYGKTSTSLDRTNYPFGPYLRTGVPANPVPEADASGTVDVDGVSVVTGAGAISPDAASAVTGWKFNSDTGQLIANSDDLSSDGVLAYSAF